MKILVVYNQWPFPENQNGVTKVICNLTSFNDDIEFDLISPNKGEDQSLFKRVHTINTSGEFSLIKWFLKGLPQESLTLIKWHGEVAKKIEEIHNEYELIHIYSAANAPIIEMLNKEIQKKCILSAIDAMSLFFSRRAKEEKSIKLHLYERESKNWKKLERNLYPAFKSVHVVSENDQKYLNELGLDNIKTIENGVLLEEKNLQEREGNRLVFWGDLGYAPNKAALEFLTEMILPEIKQKLIVFGKNLDPQIKENPWIEYKGFVPSLPEELRSHDLFLCPLPFGTGIKNKVLEAMSFRVPVISSPIAVEGIGCLDQEHFQLVSQFEVAHWVQAIEKMQKNNEFREKIVEKARDFVEKNYSWESKRDMLKRVYIEAKE